MAKARDIRANERVLPANFPMRLKLRSANSQFGKPSLRHQFFDLSKRAKRPCLDQASLELTVSREDEPAFIPGFGNSRVAHPNSRHGAQVGGDVEVDIKSRIDRA